MGPLVVVVIPTISEHLAHCHTFQYFCFDLQWFQLPQKKFLLCLGLTHSSVAPSGPILTPDTATPPPWPCPRPLHLGNSPLHYLNAEDPTFQILPCIFSLPVPKFIDPCVNTLITTTFLLPLSSFIVSHFFQPSYIWYMWLTLVYSIYSKFYLPLSLILTWEKTEPLLNLTLFLHIMNLYPSNWTWWENKYTNMLAGLLQTCKDQPLMGPNAIFNPTTFPKMFICPLPPSCNSEGMWSEEWTVIL